MRNSPLKLPSCFEDNDYFIFLKEEDRIAVIRRDRDSKALRTCLKTPELFLSHAGILKDSRTTKASISKLEDDTPVFIKRYNNKGFLHTLKYFFKTPRAIKAFHNAWIFEACDIPVPRAQGIVLFRHLGFTKVSYLVTDTVNDSMATLDFFKLLERDSFLFVKFTETILAYLSIAHGHGLRHGDLKMSNIFCRKSQDGYSFGFWDLDVATFSGKPLSRKLRAAELARLISSYIEIGRRLSIELPIHETSEHFIPIYEKLSKISFRQDEIIPGIEKFLNR